MPKLGKNLIFHLKYQAEMDRLYWNQTDGDPVDLPEPEETMRMVETVGDASKREAAEFLKLCGDTLTDHLGKFLNVKMKTHHAHIEKSWDLPYVVWRKGGKAPSAWKIYVGVFLHDKAGGAILPWIWISAGSNTIADIKDYLGDKVATSTEPYFDSKTLLLGRIPIPSLESTNLDVDAEVLLEQLRGRISSLTIQDFQYMFSIC
jgi:hypothetical protein